ncbi:MAG: hypothetical protein LN569_01045 [Rickettsia endosymbiont of Labidopullus appendiculatus]|nr:hypothetical protein [Rickettsia endosymbiont of Labidopullus appendiculatus]
MIPNNKLKIIFAQWLLSVIPITDISACSKENLKLDLLMNGDNPPLRRKTNIRLQQQSENTETLAPLKRRIVDGSYIMKYVGEIAGIVSLNTSGDPILQDVVIFDSVGNIIPINTSVTHKVVNLEHDLLMNGDNPPLRRKTNIRLQQQSENTETLAPLKRRIVDDSYIMKYVGEIAGIVSPNTSRYPILQDVVIFDNVYDSLAINKAKLNDMGSKLEEQTEKQQEKNVGVVSRIKSMCNLVRNLSSSAMRKFRPNVQQRFLYRTPQYSSIEYSDEDIDVSSTVKRHNTILHNTPKNISVIADDASSKQGVSRKISSTDENQHLSSSAKRIPLVIPTGIKKILMIIF